MKLFFIFRTFRHRVTDARSAGNHVVTDARFSITSSDLMPYRTCYGRSLRLEKKGGIVEEFNKKLLSTKEIPYDQKISHLSATSSICAETV